MAPATGYFPARTEVPGEESIDDVNLDAYLSSFASNEAIQEDREEPEWARVMRLLEALPVVKEKSTDILSR